MRTDALTKIGTFIVSVEIFNAIFLPKSCLYVVFSQILLCIVLLAFQFHLISQESLSQRRSCHELLNHLIIKMRSGESFRSALDKLSAENPRWSRWNHKFSPDLHQSWHEVWSEEQLLRQEFSQIHRESHQAMSRLVALRAQFGKISDFRRRSGQVLLQIRMQAAVLFVMQVALTIFVANRWGVREQLSLFVIASLLHILGVLVLLTMGRRMKWTL